MHNPWKITSIYDLQYFNCPSCVYKNHSKQEFINHAYEVHPVCVNHLDNVDDNSLGDISCPWNNSDVKTTEKKTGLSQNEDPKSEILTTVNVENVKNELEDSIKFNKTKKSIRSNVDPKKKRKSKAAEIDNTSTRYVFKSNNNNNFWSQGCMLE